MNWPMDWPMDWTMSSRATWSTGWTKRSMQALLNKTQLTRVMTQGMSIHEHP
jgi:hypothetical protein